MLPSDRPVVLVGMMGSGKSSIGHALAERLHRDHADTDALVELGAKMTIRELFERHGEAEFRRAELWVLDKVLRLHEPGPPVVSAGGGIVTTPEARRMLGSSRAYVVWLRARPATLAARLAGVTDRPLLDGDAVGSLERLSQERAGWYAEVADRVVDVDERSVDEVVEELLA